MALGPFTPGFVADRAMASQLAEIGVSLLMFGVGLHFSIKDLLAVRKIVIPGAIAQIAVAAVLGLLLVSYWGWSIGRRYGEPFASRESLGVRTLVGLDLFS